MTIWIFLVGSVGDIPSECELDKFCGDILKRNKNSFLISDKWAIS